MLGTQSVCGAPVKVKLCQDIVGAQTATPEFRGMDEFGAELH